MTYIEREIEKDARRIRRAFVFKKRFKTEKNIFFEEFEEAVEELHLE